MTPEDFVGAVKDAGLGEFAYTAPSSGHWPTLREMIDSGKRVVFLAENKAGAAPWYQLAYERSRRRRRTRSARSAAHEAGRAGSELQPNRGPEGAPVFLLNHWVSTDPLPLPSHAAR